MSAENREFEISEIVGLLQKEAIRIASTDGYRLMHRPGDLKVDEGGATLLVNCRQYEEFRCGQVVKFMHCGGKVFYLLNFVEVRCKIGKANTEALYCVLAEKNDDGCPRVSCSNEATFGRTKQKVHLYAVDGLMKC